ncbi:MAG: TM2 domain-containing protein [Candidatus Heimdallarchaeota archaeon]|nr:TM2 domain-containing protein [Candidatus Heimdallarchaeota archaeon]MBY8995282.1 TM2 domain-containing protein [Candidatus Heimdallarchaeota archaeon]
MINLKARKSSLMLSVIILSLFITPFLATKGETYQLFYADFYIEPSKPEVLAEMDFTLNDLNDYVFGLPSLSAVGTFTDSRTYFFEIWTEDNARVEIFILDSNDYLDYERDFIGDPPTTYFLHEICDGYRQFEFSNSSISPKLILYSDGIIVHGNFIWTEGLTETIYQPYYRRILESDRTTQDNVQIFNVNASVSCYIMTQDEYESFAADPNDKPNLYSVYEGEEDSFNISLNFETLADPDPDPEVENHYHLLIWHEEFYGGVSGTIIYNYDYARAFGETYWSLIFVFVLLIGIVLFFAFQKVVLPPVVWTFTKIRYYIISVPVREIKATFSDLRVEVGHIWDRLSGIEELEAEAEKECSPHSRLLILFQSIIGFVGLQRYMVGKTGTGIVFTCTFGFLGIGYLIDLIAVITGSFYDSDEKKVKNWL